MGKHAALPPLIAHLATHQQGILTRQQALKNGLTDENLRRLVADRYWQRIAQGVYFTQHGPTNWDSMAWAGTLIGGNGAGLCVWSAARAWGLVKDEDMPITVLLPPDRWRRPRHPWWKFEQAPLPFEVTGNPPRTTVARTVLDLCAVEPHRSAHWITTAVGGRHTTFYAVQRELRASPEHPAQEQLVQLLADVRQGAHSSLELLYLETVERAHALPVGARQTRRRKYFIDVYYEQGLVVELDGRLGHADAGVFRDMERDNYHTLQGLTTLRFGWLQCQMNPCMVAETVARALVTLGWSDDLQPCPRCQPDRSRTAA